MADHKCPGCKGPQKAFCDGEGNIRHVRMSADGIVSLAAPATILCPEKHKARYPMQQFRSVGEERILIAELMPEMVLDHGMMLVANPVADRMPPPPVVAEADESAEDVPAEDGD